MHPEKVVISPPAPLRFLITNMMRCETESGIASHDAIKRKAGQKNSCPARVR